MGLPKERHLMDISGDGVEEGAKDGAEESLIRSPLVAHSEHRLRGPFYLLQKAYEYAVDGHEWEFAVDITSLQEAGFTANDLRLLMRDGHLQHAHESTLPESKHRSFVNRDSGHFSAASNFVLTAAGFAFTGETLGRMAAADADNHAPVTNGNACPFWDAEQRTLMFAGHTIKRFRVRAANQEMILQVFQEENWPYRIDDPLSPKEGIDPKKRLNNTVQKLNGTQVNDLIQFHCDGKAEGVTWEKKS